VKVTLLFQREDGTDDASWVVDAVDEYTLDEWGGEMPTAVQKKIDDDPGNHRLLTVEVPDSAVRDLWKVPEVKVKVVDNP
jgi:hypothetical protein